MKDSAELHDVHEKVTKSIVSSRFSSENQLYQGDPDDGWLLQGRRFYCKRARMRNRTIDQTDVILETVKCFIYLLLQSMVV